VTLFFWRHKLLAALKQLSVSDFEGIVELVETYFQYSEKGNRNIQERNLCKRGVSSLK
jgi:hypothetical protein